MPETTIRDTATPATAAADLTRPYRFWYEHETTTDEERAQVITPDRLTAAIAANLRKVKGNIRWRKTAPDTGDARTFYIMHHHRKLGGEYLSIGQLPILNHEIGSIAYLQWERTFDQLQAIARATAQARKEAEA